MAELNLLVHNHVSPSAQTNFSIVSLVRCSWNSDTNRYTKHCYRLVLGGPWSSCRYLVDHSMPSLHSLGQHISIRGRGQSSMGSAGGDAPLAGWGGRNAGLCHLTGFCVQGNFRVHAVAPVPLWCQGPLFLLSEVAPSCALEECETPGGLCFFLGF